MAFPEIHWLGHAAFLLKTGGGLTLCIDPFQLHPGLPKADIILITHAHHDHCSPADLALVEGKDTVIVAPPPAVAKLAETGRKAHPLPPGAKTVVKGITIEAVPAYNIGKKFHPKEDGNAGFIMELDGRRVYHAGDTDRIPEMKSFRADIAMLPIGGTYTMTPQEAAQAALDVGAETVIPMHYGTHVGRPEDAQEFAKYVQKGLTILQKE